LSGGSAGWRFARRRAARSSGSKSAPVGGELASDVQAFVVRDSRFILLGKPGTERPTTVFHGTYYGRKIEDVGPPSEGQVIF
jgi:hypothetical protein